MENKIAYCGLDCEKCDAYIATKTNDDSLREKTATLWSKSNNVTITKDMINCTGCRTDGIKTQFCDRFCEIRKCARGKNFETCGECSLLEHCEVVAMVVKNNKDCLKRLKEKK